jgi:nucleoside phosphorylase
VAHKLPIDRGEANRAMVLLCFRLSEEVKSKDAKLATDLHSAAIRIATDTRMAGSRTNSVSSIGLVDVFSSVWPLLSLAVIPEDNSLQSGLAKLLRAQSIRIGIVTALPKEFAAIRVMLEEETPSPVAGDPNDYVVGTIPAKDGSGFHIVAVTLLKEMGNNSAAAAASHLLRSFPTIEDVIVVGIAGGIPNLEFAEKHVRLGDIVVSNSSGVVQYDNLKIGIEKIRLRGSSSKPSARMVGASRLLESERLMKRYPWEAFLQRAASRVEDAFRPADETDHLYEWVNGLPVGTEHPVDAGRRAGLPKLHYGTIGAANVLLKNPGLRDQIGRDCGVLAVEMEGSGIADAAWTAGQQYMVVRGISDYCDDKKNDT